MPRKQMVKRSNVRLASRKKVGRFIRERRRELKLTQEDVMKALGYGSPISVSEVELGRVGVPYRRVYQYADVLRLPREEFADFVMRGIQSANGSARLRLQDRRKRALGPAEQELVETFRRLPAGHKVRVRKQIRDYLALQGKRARAARGKPPRRRST